MTDIRKPRGVTLTPYPISQNLSAVHLQVGVRAIDALVNATVVDLALPAN